MYPTQSKSWQNPPTPFLKSNFKQIFVDYFPIESIWQIFLSRNLYPGGGFSWGGGEVRGEKAYNCNWITIKNKFKKKRNLYPTHDFSSMENSNKWLVKTTRKSARKSCIFLPEVSCPLKMEAIRSREFRISCWNDFSVTMGT